MRTLILLLLVFAGCEKPTETPINTVTYKVYTELPVGIKQPDVIDDVMAASNWSRTFVYEGDVTQSPDLQLQAYRYYDISCDNEGTPYNNKEGYITTEIWYNGELVCTNTIFVPTYANSDGLYLVSECQYDIE
jgi:hypothetical protein